MKNLLIGKDQIRQLTIDNGQWKIENGKFNQSIIQSISHSVINSFSHSVNPSFENRK